ncbi:hypothetical protein GOP47_0021470 [Adiantum capillus-veneris]|uniref:GPI-anchored wall transfer protein n=1 Tax=Adiantum capillus-veneris TaxID=13818 RepID=A0A9D4U7J7_ADICA|nr:hypothetical protein GOP47_0021470 [Adiantum capillus-veneris]
MQFFFGNYSDLAVAWKQKAFLLLCKCYQVHLKADANKGARTCCVWSLFVEFTFIVIPTLSILTVLNGKVYPLTAVLVCGLVLAFLMKRRQLEAAQISNKDKHQEKLLRLQFLSSYRFVVMLVTCLTILAVDFKIFPRRYAKTETYGTGLMDVGVGSFVVVNAVVSRKARGLSILKGKSRVLQNTGPLLLLGFARLLFTKQADYQVHVGEYGVHWNFFFTLAAVALLTNIINIPAHLSGIFGASILFVYQLCLLGGLNSYLNTTQRGASLISQNKEGIFSLVGYWGLYLLGVQLGYLFFQSRKSKSGLLTPLGVAGIWALAFLFWSLTVLFDRFLERTSRRSCNVAYASFILAVNLEGLGVLASLEVFPNMQLLLLEKIITENLLATFLLANVLTGLLQRQRMCCNLQIFAKAANLD